MLNLNHKIQSKTIRVFLSSTFADMQEEREHLMNVVFPHLRVLARNHDVEFTEVDLRWGITEDDAQNGKVLRLCLKEIDLCKEKSGELPFFIGLLGDRYGWQPDRGELQGDSDLMLDFPQVSDYLDRKHSITEMEMDYGILSRLNGDKDLIDKSFFFFRDVAYSHDLQQRFTEVKYLDEDAACIDSLKEKVRSALSQNPPMQYASKEELGASIISAFTAFLKNHFSQEKVENELNDVSSDIEYNRYIKQLQQAEREHAIFAQTRTHFYLERPGLFDQINRELENEHPVVVIAKQGMGKSALMANYIASLQRVNSNTEFFYHFCGGTTNSDSLYEMLRRLIAELQLARNYKIDVPRRDEELAPAFLNELNLVSEQRDILIAIDAIDQLDRLDNLNWIPSINYPHIKLVLSLRSMSDSEDSKTVGRLKDKGFVGVNIAPLSVDERKLIVEKVLGDFSKRLPEELLNEVAESKQAENPFILRSVIEEMRLLGNHTTLYTDIRSYLNIDSNDGIFNKILSRIERDFNESPQVLSFLATSRNGLTEQEILRLVGENNVDLAFTQARWSALYETMRSHLKESNGCLTWFHGIIQRSAEERYLKEQATIDAFRKAQVDYFIGMDRLDSRVLKNLPWLYLQLGNYEELGRYIGDSDVFLNLSDIEGYTTIRSYVFSLKNRFDFYEFISDSITDEEDDEKRALKYLALARFYYEANELEEAKMMFKEGTELLNTLPKEKWLETMLYASSDLGKVCFLLQDYAPAMEIQIFVRHTIERLNERKPQYDYLYAREHLRKATLQIKLEDYLMAEVSCVEAIEIYEKLSVEMKVDYNAEFALAYANLGSVYKSTGRLEEAMVELNKAVEIYRTLYGNNPDLYAAELVVVLNNLGEIKKDQCNYELALVDFNEADKILRGLVKHSPEKYNALLANTICNKANLQCKSQCFDDAVESCNNAIAIQKELVSRYHDACCDDLARSYKIRGEAYIGLKDYDAALDSFNLALENFKDRSHRLMSISNNSDIPETLTLIGVVNRELKYYPGALVAFKKALRLYYKQHEYTYNHDKDIADTLVLVNEMYREKVKGSSFIYQYRGVLEERKKVAEENPVYFNSKLCVVLNDLEVTLVERDKLESMLAERQELLSQKRELNRIEPGVYSAELALPILDVVTMYLALNDIEEARCVFDEYKWLSADLNNSLCYISHDIDWTKIMFEHFSDADGDFSDASINSNNGLRAHFMALLEDEKYMQAFDMLEELNLSDASRINAQGVCYLRMKMYKKAQECFSQIAGESAVVCAEVSGSDFEVSATEKAAFGSGETIEWTIGEETTKSTAEVEKVVVKEGSVEWTFDDEVAGEEGADTNGSGRIEYIMNLLLSLLFLKKFDDYQGVLKDLDITQIMDPGIQEIITSYTKWKEGIDKEVANVSLLKRRKRKKELLETEISFEEPLGCFDF